MAKIKIFAMNDCDWVAAENLMEAKELYLKTYDLTPDEAFDHPRALTARQMDEHKYFGWTRNPPTEDVSFREQLDYLIAKGTEFPAMFASSEV